MKRFDWQSFEHMCEWVLDEKPEPDNMTHEHKIGSGVMSGLITIEEAYDLIVDPRQPGVVGSVIAEPLHNQA